MMGEKLKIARKEMNYDSTFYNILVENQTGSYMKLVESVLDQTEPD